MNDLEELIIGINTEIYKSEEALGIYNLIADNANSINEKDFGSFFESVQRNMLDTLFLSIAKIYDYDDRAISLPSIRKQLENIGDKELAKYIQENNPYKNEIRNGIKDSRDKLIAHLEVGMNKSDLNTISWEKITVLLNFAKEIRVKISNNYNIDIPNYYGIHSVNNLNKILINLKVIED